MRVAILVSWFAFTASFTGLSTHMLRTTAANEAQAAAKRTAEELHVEESAGQIRPEWVRHWLPEQPEHLRPVRVHGGVYP